MAYNSTDETEADMFARIKAHVKGWSAISAADQLEFKRLSGLSNACYRVSPKDPELAVLVEPSALLYRKKVSEVVDKTQEAIVFEVMSAQGMGPQCFYQDDDFRIEQFFEGRPLSIWELRSPVILRKLMRALVSLHFNKEAIDQVQAHKPLDVSNLGIDAPIN